MRFLDLFCCCGGISQGLKQAIPDAEIYGVDITNGHDYPFNFRQYDVFDLTMNTLRSFDLIHASPPCQAYSFGTKGARNKGKEYPDLIQRTRDLLLKTGKPFILENVVGAPLRRDLMLCGEMFGLRVLRHRIFEIHGFTIMQPPHQKHKNTVAKGEAIGVWSGGRPGCWGKRSHYMQVAGHGGDLYSFKFQDWKDAMDIQWVTKKNHLTQMIPPAYYEFIVRSSPFCSSPLLIKNG